MATITFYPVGNGDTCQIKLNNGKRILLDFRHCSNAEDPASPYFDLKANLKDELKSADRDDIDVLAFTHADNDHIQGSTDFFELLHAEKYKGSGRIKIKELWVPAAMLVESATHTQRSNEFVLWRQEARFRLKQGSGIRIFSKPELMKAWMSANEIDFESRRHLFSDAGTVTPGFSLKDDGVEFFCHSPFVKHVDHGDDLRNGASLIFNIRFQAGHYTYDYLAVGDSEWCNLEEIVSATQLHGNNERLCWDLFNIPHHCSYLALSDQKGSFETEPKPKIKELLMMAREGAHIVSSSKPILDSADGRAQVQPPHIQAKKSYMKYLVACGGGRFFVTMEEPNKYQPKPLVFKVSEQGIRQDRTLILPAFEQVVSNPTPRAG